MQPHSHLPDPPAYRVEDAVATNAQEKSRPECNHDRSHTPLLDYYLAKPVVQVRLQALATAIADIGHEEACTKCSAERIAGILNDGLRDLRISKDTGQWDREEKKQLKMESKGLFKSMKKDMKSAWKAKRSPAL